MESHYAIYAAIGLGLIALLVFLVLSFKTWRVFHLLALFCVFCAASTFVFYAALVAKTRIAWMERHDEYKLALKEEKKRGDELVYGDLLETTGQTEPTLNELEVEIDRWLYDRGRVWRDAIPSPTGNEINVQTHVPVPGEAAEDVPANGIQTDTLLFAFVEADDDGDGIKTPQGYVGKYRVTAATDTSVTITPVIPLDEMQLTLMRGAPAGSTWVLYETMPRDGRHIYQKGDGLDATEIMKLFPTMNQLATILPLSLFPSTMTPEEYTEVLKKTHEQMQIDYLYDGQPVTDIQQKFPDFDPPPENVYFKIKFKNLETPEIISVGSLEDLTAERLDGLNQDPYDRSYFDSNGQALLASLKQVGGDTELNNGDQIIFDRTTAQNYIDLERAELVNRYYFRPLRDYEYYFDDLREQGNDLDESKSSVAARTAKVKEAQAKLYGDDVDNPMAQIGARTVEKGNLEEDLNHFKYELEQLIAERKKLEAQTSKLSATLQEVIRVTESQEDELETIQFRLKSEIDARTAVPVSSGL